MGSTNHGASPIGVAESAFRTMGEDEAIASVLAAGARARAVADACEAQHLGAVLLDGAGRVLHVGCHAPRLFADRLRLEAEHIVGTDRQSNAAIEAVLNHALRADSAAPDAATVRTARIAADRPLAIAALPHRDESPVQLLRAVLLLADDEQALRDGIDRLAA